MSGRFILHTELSSVSRRRSVVAWIFTRCLRMFTILQYKSVRVRKVYFNLDTHCLNLNNTQGSVILSTAAKKTVNNFIWIQRSHLSGIRGGSVFHSCSARRPHVWQFTLWIITHGLASAPSHPIWCHTRPALESAPSLPRRYLQISGALFLFLQHAD